MSEPVFGNIPLACIRPSTTNPRKRFNDASLEELSASIKEHGVAQPILVRPIPDEADQVEIVAGERRYRASKLAGLETIPAIVRNLTDVQALEIQVIENLQREDVHPIEEAEGYGRLRDEYGYTADQLAESVGKSKAYIYGRLKYLELGDAGREAFYADQISASTALLIARIPGEALQTKATDEICTLHGSPMSYRVAQRHIQQRYMLDLTQAIFNIKDAKLLKGVGSCETCPKRAGSQPLLFADVPADMCTDPDCFDRKKKANNEKLETSAKKSGLKIFEAAEIWNAAQENDWSFDERLHHFDRLLTSEQTNSSAKLTDLLSDKQMPKPMAYGKTREGKTLPMYEKSSIQAALEKAGFCETIDQYAARMHEIVGTDGDTEGSNRVLNEAKPSRASLFAKAETSFREELYKQVRMAAHASFDKRILAAALICLFRQESFPSDSGYDFNVNSIEETSAYLVDASLEDLQVAMLDMTFGNILRVTTWCIKDDGKLDEDIEEHDDYLSLLELAKSFNIDVETMRASHLSELNPVSEVAPKVEKKATKKASKAKEPAGIEPVGGWPFPKATAA